MHVVAGGSDNGVARSIAVDGYVRRGRKWIGGLGAKSYGVRFLRIVIAPLHSVAGFDMNGSFEETIQRRGLQAAGSGHNFTYASSDMLVAMNDTNGIVVAVMIGVGLHLTV